MKGILPFTFACYTSWKSWATHDIYSRVIACKPWLGLLTIATYTERTSACPSLHIHVYIVLPWRTRYPRTLTTVIICFFGYITICFPTLTSQTYLPILDTMHVSTIHQELAACWRGRWPPLQLLQYYTRYVWLVMLILFTFVFGLGGQHGPCSVPFSTSSNFTFLNYVLHWQVTSHAWEILTSGIDVVRTNIHSSLTPFPSHSH